MPTIIVDANIMVGALRGRSLPLLAALAERMPVVTPVPQLAETQKTLNRLGHGDTAARMRNLLNIVAPLPLGLYAHMEAKARERLQPRGQPDWPLLAAALALGGHIWSRDGDLFGTGVPLWFTRNIPFVEADLP
jgi:predicted nucleic acid-binding protein